MNKLRVRMYRQGLGDSFLLTYWPDEEEEPTHLLIDSGVLKGTVDAEWLAAFGESAPLDVPWRLEDGNVLLFGPLPLRDVAGYLGALRSQINKANECVQGERHRRAMAEYLDAEERARAYRQAMEALSGLFHRRLSTLEAS